MCEHLLCRNNLNLMFVSREETMTSSLGKQRVSDLEYFTPQTSPSRLSNKYSTWHFSTSFPPDANHSPTSSYAESNTIVPPSFCSEDKCFGDSRGNRFESLKFALLQESFPKFVFPSKPVVEKNGVVHIDIAPWKDSDNGPGGREAGREASGREEDLQQIYEIQVFKSKVAVESAVSLEMADHGTRGGDGKHSSLVIPESCLFRGKMEPPSAIPEQKSGSIVLAEEAFMQTDASQPDRGKNRKSKLKKNLLNGLIFCLTWCV